MPRSADYRHRADEYRALAAKAADEREREASYRSPRCWKHWLKTRSSEKKRSNSQRRRPPHVWMAPN
jgi:hypothetical protein